MKLTSVKGVKSLRLGSYCRVPGETYLRGTSSCATYAFHPIVGCLPSTQLSYDDWGTIHWHERMRYPRIVYLKEDIIHAQRESRKDKDKSRHDVLYEHMSKTNAKTNQGNAYTDDSESNWDDPLLYSLSSDRGTSAQNRVGCDLVNLESRMSAQSRLDRRPSTGTSLNRMARQGAGGVRDMSSCRGMVRSERPHGRQGALGIERQRPPQ